MKNLSKNKKGFTLIELLAVIVILAILVMVAIPAVTSYLTTARVSAFSDNAHRAIDAVRTDVITKGFGGGNSHCTDGTCTYNLNDINGLLEQGLKTSPFGGAYTAATVVVSQDNSNAANPIYTYQMCIKDANNNGFNMTDEKSISSDIVETNNSNITCS